MVEANDGDVLIDTEGKKTTDGMKECGRALRRGSGQR